MRQPESQKEGKEACVVSRLVLLEWEGGEGYAAGAGAVTIIPRPAVRVPLRDRTDGSGLRSRSSHGVRR